MLKLELFNGKFGSICCNTKEKSLEQKCQFIVIHSLIFLLLNLSKTMLVGSILNTLISEFNQYIILFVLEIFIFRLSWAFITIHLSIFVFNHIHLYLLFIRIKIRVTYRRLLAENKIISLFNLE